MHHMNSPFPKHRRIYIPDSPEFHDIVACERWNEYFRRGMAALYCVAAASGAGIPGDLRDVTALVEPSHRLEVLSADRTPYVTELALGRSRDILG